jgi:hypothetical protein
MTANDNCVRHCPKCGSVRVRDSRRKGFFEGLLVSLGGEICRCHDCCCRQAWFGGSPIPIGNRDPEAPAWARLLVVGSGGAVVAVVWWVIDRLAGKSS